MKIYFEANKKWIFALKMIKESDFWREDSNFSRSKVNFQCFLNCRFGAKIKIGEKLRISEHCAMVLKLVASEEKIVGIWKRITASSLRKELVRRCYATGNESFIFNWLMPAEHVTPPTLKLSHFYVQSSQILVKNVLETLRIQRSTWVLKTES